MLSGNDDRLFVDRLTTLFSGQQPQGGNVVLTLDADAQRAAFDGLAGQEGAVAAIDPRTGAILALASSPSFDPNLLASHDPTEVSDSYEQAAQGPCGPPAQPLHPAGLPAGIAVQGGRHGGGAEQR